MPSIALWGLNTRNLPNFLTIGLECGYGRYWSDGKVYSHIYDNFYYNTHFRINYKKLSFLGQFTKNDDSLWGQIAARMMFPLENNYKTGKERLGTVAPYVSWSYIKESGQMLLIRLNYHFDFGKKHNTSDKRTNNSDSDSGILSF